MVGLDLSFETLESNIEELSPATMGGRKADSRLNSKKILLTFPLQVPNFFVRRLIEKGKYSLGKNFQRNL